MKQFYKLFLVAAIAMLGSCRSIEMPYFTVGDMTSVTVIPSEGDTYKVNVRSNVAWTAMPQGEGCTVITGPDGAIITVDMNPTTLAREISVLFVGNEGATETWTRMQASSVAETYFSDADSVIPTGEATAPVTGAVYELAVVSKLDWEIEAVSNCTAEKNEAGDGVIVTVAENTMASAREVSVAIKSVYGSVSDVLVFTQAAPAAMISFTLDDGDTANGVPAEGYVYKITVVTNSSWQLESFKATNCTVSPMSGTGNTAVTITVEENTESETRDIFAKFITTNTEGETAEIPFGQYIQAVAADNFSIETTSGELGDSFPAEGATYEVTVSANVDWTLVATDCTAEINDNVVTIVVAENKTAEAKTPKVVFSATGFSDITWGGVEQAAIFSDMRVANCYIMAPTAGTFTFPIEDRIAEYHTTINFSAVESDWSCEVLWSELKDNAGSVSVAKSIGNYGITVTATDVTAGNAVVAVKLSGSTVLWSWHIWITEEPNAITLNGAQVMDRNVGAFGAEYKAGGDLFYQYGRKDPFVGSNYTVATDATTMAASVQNPTTYYATSAANWCTEGAVTEWNTSLFDPSPAGWEMPSIDILMLPTDSIEANRTDAGALNYLMCNGLMFSSTGYINRESGVLGEVGVCGGAWSSTITDDSVKSYGLLYNSYIVWNKCPNYKAMGLPARSVKASN